MRGRDGAGTSLRGRRLFPALCLKKRYRGNQEDSAGFLMECLQTCDSIKELFKGRYCRATKECSSCGHSIFVEGSENDQIFTSLEVDCRCRTTGDFFPDIQTALNASFREDLDTDLRCGSCGACWSHKRKEVQEPPKVLLLQVHQWDNVQTGDGRFIMRRIPSEMLLSQDVTLCSKRFPLQGIICHQGESAYSGHYVAVAKHGDDSESFFLYNDDLRVKPRADLACTMQLQSGHGNQRFHASALLYELCDMEVAL